MAIIPKIAFLPDSFHEINGAARTCRELVAFARRQGYPMMNVRYGREPGERREGSVSVLELARGRFAVPVDDDLSFDPFFFRQRRRLLSRLREFRPDLVHITSPGDMGILGLIAARSLRIPLVLSWHTNLHEFASRRVARLFSSFPGVFRNRVPAAVERFVLGRVVWFFGLGDVLLAPNDELIRLLESRTGRPAFLMARGIDTEAFHPRRRTRPESDKSVVIGYAGRLTPEKNVRFLAGIERRLKEAGAGDYRFLVAGGGGERAWLEANLERAEFTGVLGPQAVAEAFANMDIFVFPSHTDTFGNVVQEAFACGVPAVVTSSGGPKFIVNHGVDGLVSDSDDDFLENVLRLARDAGLRKEMGRRARLAVESRSWDRVFEGVYRAYAAALERRG